VAQGSVRVWLPVSPRCMLIWMPVALVRREGMPRRICVLDVGNVDEAGVLHKNASPQCEQFLSSMGGSTVCSRAARSGVHAKPPSGALVRCGSGSRGRLFRGRYAEGEEARAGRCLVRANGAGAPSVHTCSHDAGEYVC